MRAQEWRRWLPPWSAEPSGHCFYLPRGSQAELARRQAKGGWEGSDQSEQMSGELSMLRQVCWLPGHLGLAQA